MQRLAHDVLWYRKVSKYNAIEWYVKKPRNEPSMSSAQLYQSNHS